MLDVDLTNFTTTKLSLGITTEVRGVANAPRALLFVTEKSLYRRPLPDGEIEENLRCANRILLRRCSLQSSEAWNSAHVPNKGLVAIGHPIIYGSRTQVASLIARRVNALVGAVFDRDGQFLRVRR